MYALGAASPGDGGVAIDPGKRSRRTWGGWTRLVGRRGGRRGRQRSMKKVRCTNRRIVAGEASNPREGTSRSRAGMRASMRSAKRRDAVSLAAFQGSGWRPLGWKAKLNRATAPAPTLRRASGARSGATAAGSNGWTRTRIVGAHYILRGSSWGAFAVGSGQRSVAHQRLGAEQRGWARGGATPSRRLSRNLHANRAGLAVPQRHCRAAH